MSTHVCRTCGAPLAMDFPADAVTPQAEAAPRIMTDRDAARLNAFLLFENQLDASLTTRLKELVKAAAIVPMSDVPAGLVTLDSDLRYSVGQLAPETRRLVLPNAGHHSGSFVSAASTLGLAFIGRLAPARFSIPGSNDHFQTIDLLSVEQFQA